MKQFLPAPGAIAACILGLVIACGLRPMASAQTPNPVTPGYQVCNTNDPGNTRCSFQPVDATHGLPVAATITPSGTQNVNVTQILGAAPSLTNPLWMFPATGATFPVSGTFWQATQPVSGTVTATVSVGPYPTGATPTTNSATGTTGATTATLAAASAKNTYLCGFTITSDATAAVAGTATVVGPVGGTMSFIQNVGAATAAGILTQTFNPCIPSNAVNTAIVVNSVAAGVGGNTAVTVWGYQL